MTHNNHIYEGWSVRPYGTWDWTRQSKRCSSQLHMHLNFLANDGHQVYHAIEERTIQTNGIQRLWSGWCEWLHGGQVASPWLANQISRFFYIEISGEILFEKPWSHLPSHEGSPSISSEAIESTTWEKDWKCASVLSSDTWKALWIF